MKHFPLYIDLSDKNILVIGGGQIATRRVTTLLSFNPVITLLSPEVGDTLHSYITQGKITWEKSSFPGNTDDPIPLKKYDMILAATNSREVNHTVYKYAKKESIPVNVCDCQEECDFFFPAIIESTHAIASVTANGSNHTLVSRLAANIRTLLQELDP